MSSTGIVSKGNPKHTWKFHGMSKKPAKQLAIKALKKIRKINRNKEAYMVDVSQVASSVTTGGTITLLSGIAEGDTELDRSGLTVNLKSLSIRMAVTVGDAVNVVRVLIVQDKLTKTVLSALSDILDSSTSDTIIAPIQRVNRSRFKVLLDRSFALSTSGPAVLVDKAFRKLNFKEYFAGATGAIGSINRNGIYLVAVLDSSAATHPTLGFSCRIKFTEDS